MEYPLLYNYQMKKRPTNPFSWHRFHPVGGCSWQPLATWTLSTVFEHKALRRKPSNCLCLQVSLARILPSCSRAAKNMSEISVIAFTVLSLYVFAFLFQKLINMFGCQTAHRKEAVHWVIVQNEGLSYRAASAQQLESLFQMCRSSTFEWNWKNF